MENRFERQAPAFDRYIGIDYSGAETPNASLKGLRVYKADQGAAPGPCWGAGWFARAWANKKPWIASDRSAGTRPWPTSLPLLGSGYVVKSLEAALLAFHNSHSFKEGALLAVKLGNDADTTGAVYGQIAGAFYRYEGILEKWRHKISRRDLVESFSVQLRRLSLL